MSHAEATHPSTCLSCGAHIPSNYCPNCGEKAINSHDLAVSHLAHDFWHEFTHVDGKVWGTLRALLFQPGELTRAYWAGRRGIHLRPLRIFLIITALFLVLLPNAAGPLGLKVFATQTPKGTDLTIAARAPVFKTDPVSTKSRKFEAQDGAFNFHLDRPLTEAQITLFEQKVHKIYKFIQYLGLALFAAFSLLLGRRVQPFYGAHLIFALHYYSFVYIITALVSTLSIPSLFSLLIRLGYLSIALWRLTGKGTSSPRTYGIDWKSFGRAYLLFMLTSISELAMLGIASTISMKLI